MIYNAARVRKLSTKLQDDACKTKKRKICACTVAQLVVQIQAMIYNAAKVRRLSYNIIFKSIHANLKKEE